MAHVTFKNLPKIELHEHLDGSLRIETVLALAKENHVTLPANSPATLKPFLVPQQASLEKYLEAFAITVSVLQTESALERVAFETVEDWSKEGIIYGEVRFAPELHLRKGLTLEKVVEAVLRGINRGKNSFGLEAGVILCAMRHATNSLTIAHLVKAYEAKGVVGFDIAGAEAPYPPSRHRAAFDFIFEHRLNSTCHAGEVTDPRYIAEALDICSALRVGHGTQLFKEWIDRDEEPPVGTLSRFILDRRIPLEVCITSNVQTNACSSWETHPFPLYWKKGFALCLCTDNRLMSDTTLNIELERAAHYFNLEIDDLLKIQFQALRSAFCPYEVKRTLAKKFFPQFLL